MEERERTILLAMLSQYGEKELRDFTDKIADGYKETIEQCRPLLKRGHNIGATVGIVIALRQLADNITEQSGNIGVPLFDVMVELFNDGLKLGSVAWTTEAEEDSDGDE